MPFLDLTTNLLGLAEEPAEAILLTREACVPCGLVEAAQVYERLGAEARRLAQECSPVGPGAALLQARGSAGQLHAAWRLAQVLVALGSAVATYTRRLVEKARSVNPRVVVAATRKAPPGLRHLYYRCVLCGGASLHRFGISDSVLVFPNHYRLLGGLEKALERLKEARRLIGERPVVVEVRSLEEALLAARSGVVDEIQLDHVDPTEAAMIAERVRETNPSIRVAVGGGIGLDNIEEYAAVADVVVTSAPYSVPPIDVTTRIEKPGRSGS
jgi:molybdenum transport protein